MKEENYNFCSVTNREFTNKALAFMDIVQKFQEDAGISDGQLTAMCQKVIIAIEKAKRNDYDETIPRET